MILSLVLAMLLLPVNIQDGDSTAVHHNERNIILNRSFSEKIITETPPAGANGVEKAAWAVSNQLVGRDFYRPANYMFFRQAVKTIGFIPAIFATADRIIRDSKIGTAGARIDAEHPVIEEGPEAYAPGRNGRDGR